MPPPKIIGFEYDGPAIGARLGAPLFIFAGKLCTTTTAPLLQHANRSIPTPITLGCHWRGVLNPRSTFC